MVTFCIAVVLLCCFLLEKCLILECFVQCRKVRLFSTLEIILTILYVGTRNNWDFLYSFLMICCQNIREEALLLVGTIYTSHQRMYISDRTHSNPLRLLNMCLTQPLPALSVVYICRVHHSNYLTV